mgnify:FL=1
MQETILKHFRTLSIEIGCRPVGTEANHVASNYIETVFKSIGLNVETQEFEVPDWQLEEAFVELNGKRLEAKGNNFSEPCNVSGEIVPLCTIEELTLAPNLEGKIAFLYGELSKENYVPKGFTIYNPEHHQQTIRLLEEKKPSAIIFVRMEKENNLPIINDWDFSIPSLTVSPEVGLELKNNLPNASIRCVINSKKTEGKTSNIIGRIKGERPDKIILTAHYDTVFDTNGAFDNASGVTLLLSLAEEIAKRDDWQCGFEFIAFSSEEYLGLGDTIYLQKHKNSLQDAIVAMNFDGVGQVLGTNNMTLISGSNELETNLKELKREFPSVQWTSPWYESNHYTFFSNGVPSIPFSCTGVSDLLHTKDDTEQWISEEKLNEVHSLALEIIQNLQTKSKEWTRES